MTNIDKKIRFAQHMLGVGEERRMVNGATTFAQDIGAALANVTTPSAEDVREWQILCAAIKLAIDGCRSPKRFADELTCLTMCLSIIAGWHKQSGDGIIAIPTNFNEVQNMDQCLDMVETMGRLLRRGTVPLVESIRNLLFMPKRKSKNNKVAETFEFTGILLGMWLSQRTHLVELEEGYQAFKENTVAQGIVLGLDGKEPLTVDELVSALGFETSRSEYREYRNAVVNLASDGRILEWTFSRHKVRLAHIGHVWSARLREEMKKEGGEKT